MKCLLGLCLQEVSNSHLAGLPLYIDIVFPVLSLTFVLQYILIQIMKQFILKFMKISYKSILFDVDVHFHDIPDSHPVCFYPGKCYIQFVCNCFFFFFSFQGALSCALFVWRKKHLTCLSPAGFRLLHDLLLQEGGFTSC